MQKKGNWSVRIKLLNPSLRARSARKRSQKNQIIKLITNQNILAVVGNVQYMQGNASIQIFTTATHQRSSRQRRVIKSQPERTLFQYFHVQTVQSGHIEEDQKWNHTWFKRKFSEMWGCGCSLQKKMLEMLKENAKLKADDKSLADRIGEEEYERFYNENVRKLEYDQ